MEDVEEGYGGGEVRQGRQDRGIGDEGNASGRRGKESSGLLSKTSCKGDEGKEEEEEEEEGEEEDETKSVILLLLRGGRKKETDPFLPRPNCHAGTSNSNSRNNSGGSITAEKSHSDGPS